MTGLFSSREPAFYSALVAVIATATLLGALFFQYVLGYVPCALCYMQRWPYYAGIPLIVLATFMLRPQGFLRSSAPWVLLCIAVMFMASAGMGIYHSGVEWAWWQGPAACSPPVGGGSSVADLFGGNAPRFVSCTAASWRFGGLSFAGWNAVISALIVCIACVGAYRSKQS